ncbi:MAG: hypothetical protein JWM19_2698 [Actinomycetia bacterium]|nr:hypothetical protein [Actinomycetes bacterium]
MRKLVAARDWLTVFQLPAYASELNPVESVWSHLKRSLACLAKRDIAQLTALVKTRLRRMQYQAGFIEGFLAGTRLDLTPLCNLTRARIGSLPAAYGADLLALVSAEGDLRTKPILVAYSLAMRRG